jgi:hypothetical protein
LAFLFASSSVIKSYGSCFLNGITGALGGSFGLGSSWPTADAGACQIISRKLVKTNAEATYPRIESVDPIRVLPEDLECAFKTCIAITVLLVSR